MSTFTVSANDAGLTRLMIDIPDALSVSDLTVTDVSTTSASHYSLAVTSSTLVTTQDKPCRLLVSVTTTRPGGTVAPATAGGAIQLDFTYADLSDVTSTVTVGPLAADFVTMNAPADLTPPAELPTINVGIGGEQEILVPIGGICRVKSATVSGSDGSTWTVNRTGQADGGLWVGLTNLDTFLKVAAAKAANAAALSSSFMVLSTTDENDVVFVAANFDIDFIYF